MTKLLEKYYNTTENKYYNKLLKKIHGNNIVLTELVSNEDPFSKLNNDMREEIWYWDSGYDY